MGIVIGRICYRKELLAEEDIVIGRRNCYGKMGLLSEEGIARRDC